MYEVLCESETSFASMTEQLVWADFSYLWVNLHTGAAKINTPTFRTCFFYCVLFLSNRVMASVHFCSIIFHDRPLRRQSETQLYLLFLLYVHIWWKTDSPYCCNIKLAFWEFMIPVEREKSIDTAIAQWNWSSLFSVKSMLIKNVELLDKYIY